jgi:hypothetical protein
MRFAAIWLSAIGLCTAQTDYRSDLAHPRLLLPERRLKLVKRESQRQSMRWVAFETVAKSRTQWPEPGFALSLYYIATGDEAVGKAAIDWALSAAGNDLHQLAITFDWCNGLLASTQSEKLAAKMARLLEKTAPATDIPSIRSRVMAAIALSGHVDGVGAKYVKPAVEVWWKSEVVEPIRAGRNPVELRDHMPLFEMFHVLRDNFDIDLREASAKYFATLPAFHILAHYPAPYPAAENEYRVPLMKAHGEPDVREAARSRIAGLMMVGYDNNAQEMQFVQGWLIQDRFQLRGAYGIPYEYLWANPYQPGLSFHYLPNVFHDPASGRLLIRSTWEEDAVWFYQSGETMQMFRNGQIANMREVNEPIEMGNTHIVPAALAARFTAGLEEASRYYLIGLKPETRYELEVEDEEIREVKSDRGGVVELTFPPNRKAVVRMRLSPV